MNKEVNLAVDPEMNRKLVLLTEDQSEVDVYVRREMEAFCISGSQKICEVGRLKRKLALLGFLSLEP